jgi:hypothetical protein
MGSKLLVPRKVAADANKEIEGDLINSNTKKKQQHVDSST